MHSVNRRKKEKRKWVWLDKEYSGFGGCTVVVPIIISYVCIYQTCSPRAFAKSFGDHSSRSIVALRACGERCLIVSSLGEGIMENGFPAGPALGIPVKPAYEGSLAEA
eukprot:1094005-Pelagomonas_calceolata.AAC.1